MLLRNGSLRVSYFIYSLGGGGITKLKRLVEKNQDFMLIKLLRYCNIFGCDGKHKHM